jgi:hypothetical protein
MLGSRGWPAGWSGPTMPNEAGGHRPRSQPSPPLPIRCPGRPEATARWLPEDPFVPARCRTRPSAFLQRLHAAAHQRSDVNKHVLALLGLDEAVSPVGVEPLDGAARHQRVPFSTAPTAALGADGTSWKGRQATRPATRPNPGELAGAATVVADQGRPRDGCPRSRYVRPVESFVTRLAWTAKYWRERGRGRGVEGLPADRRTDQGAGDPINAWIRALRSRPRMKGRWPTRAGSRRSGCRRMCGHCAIVAVDLQGARPAGDALAAAAYL